MSERKPEVGDLRVWWIPQVPGQGDPFYVAVKTPAEGKLVFDTLANYDLYQFQNNIKPDYCNAGGMEIFIDEEEGWIEWVDDDGNEVKEAAV